MRGWVRVGHLSESAEKTVQVRLFGLTVMFLMTGVRLDSPTSAAWSRKRQAGKCECPLAFTVRPEDLLGSGPTIMW
jgi:hypothetical protein